MSSQASRATRRWRSNGTSPSAEDVTRARPAERDTYPVYALRYAYSMTLVPRQRLKHESATCGRIAVRFQLILEYALVDHLADRRFGDYRKKDDAPRVGASSAQKDASISRPEGDARCRAPAVQDRPVVQCSRQS